MSLRHALASAAPLGLATLATLATLAAGCGAANKEPSATPTTPKPAPSSRPTEADGQEPATVDEALEQIRVAKARLSAPHDVATPATAAQPGPKPPTPGTDPGHASACGDGCRAITSMRRAVTALCRMTGDDDARCKDARETLRTSEAKLASCSCR